MFGRTRAMIKMPIMCDIAYSAVTVNMPFYREECMSMHFVYG